MKKLGKAIFIASIFAQAFSINASAQVGSSYENQERRDLILLVDEIDYLLGKVEHLRAQHQYRNGRLKFNYKALSEQLAEAKKNTILYLNSKGRIINKQPPAIIDNDPRIYK